MSNEPKRIGNCPICGEHVLTNQLAIVVPTRRGKICVHAKCYAIEQDELKVEKEGKA